MTKNEALKLALEALEAIDKLDLGLSEYATRELTTLDAFVKATVTAIKEALAQPAQEPVAVRGAYLNKSGGVTLCAYGCEKSGYGFAGLLYTAPPAAQPAQEPRPWVGLTSEQRKEVLYKSDTAEEVAIGIEAQLKKINAEEVASQVSHGSTIHEAKEWVSRYTPYEINQVEVRE